MVAVGVRELRQNASAVIRRVEAGEAIDVTVNGRIAARLVPATPAAARSRTFSRTDFVARLGGIPADTTGWSDELRRSRDDDPVVDPWATA